MFAPTELGTTTAQLAAAFAPVTDRAGLQSRRGLPAHRPPGLDRPGHVGEGRPQPAEQRRQVHLRRRHLRVAGGVRRAGRADRSRTPAPASRRSGSSTCSSGSTGHGTPRPARRRAAASVCRWSSSWSGIHGGSVDVTSTPGEGSTFTVRIPLGFAHLPSDRLVRTGVSARTVPSLATPYVAEALRWLPDPGHRATRRGPAPGHRPSTGAGRAAIRGRARRGPRRRRAEPGPQGPGAGRRRRRGHARLPAAPAVRAVDAAGRDERDRGAGRRALGAAGPRRRRRVTARPGRHRAAPRAADRHPHGGRPGRAAVVAGRGGGRRRGPGRGRRRLPGQAVLLARAARPRREPPAAGPGAAGRRAAVPRDGRLHPRADLGGRPRRAPGVRQPRLAGLHRRDRTGRRARAGLAAPDPPGRPGAVPLGHDGGDARDGAVRGRVPAARRQRQAPVGARPRRPGRRRRPRTSATSAAAWTSTPSTGSSGGTGSTPRSASRWSARSPGPAGPTSWPAPSSTRGSRTSRWCTRPGRTSARRRSRPRRPGRRWSPRCGSSARSPRTPGRSSTSRS